VYEIIFAGPAGSVLRAEFDDCEVIMGKETTTLRVELPDQAALWELLERIMGFGLELLELRLVAVPSATSGDGVEGRDHPWDSRRSGFPGAVCLPDRPLRPG
jgi:hypothetical protein